MTKPTFSGLVRWMVAPLLLAACGGEVRIAGGQPTPQTVGCSDCGGSVLVTLSHLEWLDPEDPGLDVDVCVGLRCGQALVEVVPEPEGTVPDECIVQDGEDRKSVV